MAAKKPTKPKKFKQARTAAKADAKKVFKGKAQARLKDATTKLSADDAKNLQDIAKEARGNFITDDRGNKINVKPTESAQDRFDREGSRSREAFREQMREEGLYEKKADAPAKKTAKKAATKKAAATKEVAKKPSANKPAGKGFAAGKELNATGKARYDALIKEGVSPKKALNKALFAQEKGSKATAKTAVKPKAPGTSVATKPKFVVSTRTNTPTATKEVAVRPKPGTPVAPASAKAAAPAAKKKFSKTRKGIKGFVGATIAAELVSNLKGSTDKDLAYIQKLENRLAAAQGKPVKYKEIGASKNVVESVKSNASNLANLVSMGVVGKTRRGRMDELNQKITKAEAAKSKRIATQRAAKPGIAPAGARSSAKINKTFVTAGGSTTTAAPGSRYTVKRGDTLSAIAKSAGVKTADLIAANKQFTTNPKYKGGNMIFSGTKVRIPTKKK